MSYWAAPAVHADGPEVTATLNTFIIAAWVMPEIVAGFCWYAYLYQGGTLDSWLGHIGLSQDWLYTTPMLAVIIANVWRGTAFSMLVYSAGLSDLPPELLEAAKVDYQYLHPLLDKRGYFSGGGRS